MSEVTITRNESERRFEAHEGDELKGYIDYVLTDSVMDMPHTKVFPEFEGQGVGSALVKGALDQVREMDGGVKVKPTCPFIDVWIKRHPDYEDLRA